MYSKKFPSYIAVLAIAALGLIACEQTPLDPDPQTTDVKVSDVRLDQNSITLFVGNSATLVATVMPDNATKKTITWGSSDASVVSVSNGTVTAHKLGRATITAWAGDKSDDCVVTVTEGQLSFSLSSSDAAILKASGGSSTGVVSASNSWTLASEASWLTVSPHSGEAGDTQVQLTTSKHIDGTSRKASIAITMGDVTQRFEVVQRPNIFTRTKVSSGRVNNSVSLIYSGTKITRVYMVLPRPVSNFYQDITNWEAPECTEGFCPDGLNRFIWRDVAASDIPASGACIMSESFDADVYRVVTDFSKITDIPEYDPNSEECRTYLGKEEGGYVDPTHSKIVSTANSLWNNCFGETIPYARRCLEWTYDNMTYGNMNTGLHTIASLMQSMVGDCGNYTSVFISLLRAKGIPARHVEMVHGKKDEYHVRAEFYVPGYGWIPADPTWGSEYFGVFDGDYIVTVQGINPIVRDPDGNDAMVTLLQSYYCWWWWQTEGSFSFQHTCTGLR